LKRLAILGASGHGKVVADTAESCGWSSISFFDDAWPDVKLNGVWSVVGNTQSLLDQLADFDGVVVAIGNNRIRYEKMLQLESAGALLVPLIHPSAVVSKYASIGKASVVFAGCVVNVGCRVGKGCILNTACTVDHDAVLGDAVHISPGAHLAGGVTVGDRSWVGIGASVRQMIAIGSDVMIGAGAAVVAHVPDGETVVGVPARSFNL